MLVEHGRHVLLDSQKYTMDMLFSSSRVHFPLQARQDERAQVLPSTFRDLFQQVAKRRGAGLVELPGFAYFGLVAGELLIELCGTLVSLAFDRIHLLAECIDLVLIMVELLVELIGLLQPIVHAGRDDLFPLYGIVNDIGLVVLDANDGVFGGQLVRRGERCDACVTDVVVQRRVHGECG
jgi:hypothetical protein